MSEVRTRIEPENLIPATCPSVRVGPADHGPASCLWRDLPSPLHDTTPECGGSGTERTATNNPRPTLQIA
jgi:hypothetical protein